MTFDPTTNRVPWYLLADEERTIIKGWQHGWEISHNGSWLNTPQPGWYDTIVYRGKPKPAVTSTWQNVYPNSVSITRYNSRVEADAVVYQDRIAVLRRDTVNGVTTAHLEDV